MRKAASLLLCTLALAGCNGAGPGGTPQAGRYEVAVKVTKFNVPGLDAPKLNEMQRVLVGKETKHTYCLTPDKAAKKAQPLFEHVGQGACYLHQFNPRDGKLDALMTCRALSGRQSYSLRGTVNGNGARFVSDGLVTNNRFPQGRAEITREIVMKRIADCTAPVVKKKKKDG